MFMAPFMAPLIPVTFPLSRAFQKTANPIVNPPRKDSIGVNGMSGFLWEVVDYSLSGIFVTQSSYDKGGPPFV